ncbi:MAG: NADPH-dependent glutamate synthase [Clostridia bacterium]|nr:NADPH-dependent glutamate synthase [Clostridia bacterium]
MTINKGPRIKTPEQNADARRHNFDEVNKGYTAQMAMEEAARCLHCKDAKCVKGCPVNVNIPDFIAEVAKGNFAEGAKIIKSTNNLPAICGRVCPQEEQCEKYCIRAKSGGPVAIGALERFCADYALQNGETQEAPKRSNGMRVAVVGSGPAGLTCAADCAKEGFEVTVFEAFHKAGGVLVYGIPEFRLPKSLVQAEIDKLKELGVKIIFDTVIGKTYSLEELCSEYNAVFLGTGAGLPMFLKMKGENLPGVYSANEYLTRINLMKAYQKDSDTPVITGERVVVIGGGNVAMDAARTALRMGAKEVTIVYRRSMNELPARKEEVQNAIEEGIQFLLLNNPIEILGEKKVEGIKLQKMVLGEPDERGRAIPMCVEGSEYEVKCDMVIVAIGTSPNPLLPKSTKNLKTTPKGTIVINEDGETSIEYVYAGGDAVMGAATVILAMGAGKKAAESICKKLLR